MATGNGTVAEEPKAASSAVKVTDTSMVVPAKKTERPPCPLITFDLPYITFYYNQKLLLYKTAGKDEDFQGIVGRMKRGLAAALDYYYPLSGRIVKDEEGALVVECNGESLVGAEVIEAAAEDVAVEELAGGESTKLLQEVVPYTGIMNLEGLHRPLLAVQFTKLKDGFALGCAFNHAIMDGNSTWHFMTSWAELTRSGTATAISSPPLLDRTRVRSTRVKVDLPPSPKAHELADPNGPPKRLVGKVFSFSQTALDQLKSRANANLPPDAKPLSTFQSLGDHVWRAVCRARALKPEDITVFAIFIDCRTRVDPPMPDSYFGNLIQAIFTATAAGLLLASPAGLGAGLMQKVIDGHDAKAIGGRLEEYEGKPKMLHYTDAGINCVAVGSSPRFRVYDVDFGLGGPERVRSGMNNKFDGMMFLYPGRPTATPTATADHDKGIDVELTLDPQAMNNLELDQEFLNAAVAAA